MLGRATGLVADYGKGRAMPELKSLSDPKGMRPSIRRMDFGYADPIGVCQLTDGREAWTCWMHHTQTHVHVVAWVPGHPEFATQANVVRVQAARVTESMFVGFEA